jgi:hypothetical protein
MIFYFPVLACFAMGELLFAFTFPSRVPLNPRDDE